MAFNVNVKQDPELLQLLRQHNTEMRNLTEAVATVDYGLSKIEQYLKRIADEIAPEATALNVSPGVPTERKESLMGVKVIKKSTAGKFAAGPKKPFKAGDPAPMPVIMDNEDESYTIGATDSTGGDVDITGVATLTANSSNVTVMTVDPASGFTVQTHALSAGTCVLTFVASWNDGSKTLTIDWPQTVTGTATGLKVTPGTPVVRP